MKHIAYVSCAESGELRVYELDRSGRLHELQCLAPGGMLMPIAIRPDRQRLYVARRSEPLAVVAHAIDPADGRLTPLGEAPLAHSMASLSVDRSGRWLLSASYGGHLIAVNPLDADGRPAAPTQSIATGPNAHCILADASNHHVYATSLGGGVIGHWRFDAGSGMLTPDPDQPTLALHAGSGPRHFVFSSDARFAYLLGELDASVTVLEVASGSGRLTPVQTISALPDVFQGKPWAADLHLTPDGRHLYTSERTGSQLAIFAVDPVSGRLTLRGHQGTEAQPRGFAIDPEGRFLVATGQLSHHASSYSIDPDSGALALVDRVATGGDPNWVEIIPIDT
ncbi:lactonase family protein [Variovorax sp.]|uniref:lactonase family protein n=1 Tax=Variovorax sp. TaxID=1871043 RepID=UPI002D68631C|nr:lactonase family protein [Variovorax sp.]HYP84046.1 lactonase family protein [Variovorax sp.]